MAISGNIKLGNGIELKDCYVKIKKVTIEKTDGEYSVQIYVDENKRKEDLVVTTLTYNFYYDLTKKENAIEQAYSHFKSIKKLDKVKDI
jgi:uncharacterized membrane protein YjjP (DUF1212 family)